MKGSITKSFPALVLILILGYSAKAYPQGNSTGVTYSSESSDSSDFNYHRKYQYLDINLKEETNMFKIAVPTFSITHYTKDENSDTKNNYGILFSFEKKLNPEWSVYVENSNNYTRIASALQTQTFELALNWGLRYYFLMKNRIKEGVSGNNCNGVYIDFTVNRLNRYKYIDIKVIENSRKFAISDARIFNTPDLTLNLGLQKRLNNFSYIDSRLFFSYTLNRKEYQWDTPTESNNYALNKQLSSPLSYFVFGVEFKIGLGWGWKKIVVY